MCGVRVVRCACAPGEGLRTMPLAPATLADAVQALHDRTAEAKAQLEQARHRQHWLYRQLAASARALPSAVHEWWGAEVEPYAAELVGLPGIERDADEGAPADAPPSPMHASARDGAPSAASAGYASDGTEVGDSADAPPSPLLSSQRDDVAPPPAASK
eukprot:675811-Prymnesium_polylepis.1